jgi:hypothetical protein
MSGETPPPRRTGPRTWRDFLGVVLYGDYEPVGIVLSLLAASWALTLLGPGDTLASSPTYGRLASFAPDTVWGLAALALAVLPLVAWRGRHLLLGRMVMTAHVGFWAFVAVGFWQQARLNTGWGVYGVLALVALWVTLRIAGSARGRH